MCMYMRARVYCVWVYVLGCPLLAYVIIPNIYIFFLNHLHLKYMCIFTHIHYHCFSFNFVVNFNVDSLIRQCDSLITAQEFSTSKGYSSMCMYANTCVNVYMYIMHAYISGSGTFALLRYIYVQAFGYCRFLEKLENTLHSREPIAVF